MPTSILLPITPPARGRRGARVAPVAPVVLVWLSVLTSLPACGPATVTPSVDGASASGLASSGASTSPPATDGGAQVGASTVCSLCHANSPSATAMRDGEGHGIAPYDLWRGTMMANSARDPLWRAVVSAEVAATPSRAAEIERTCLTCHAPLAAQVGLGAPEDDSHMGVLERDDPLGILARDGVSCTICHGMSPEGLGTEASFSAGYTIDLEGRLFGPHEKPFTMPMRHHTGFTPTYGEHILDAAMCGSCHTLVTDTFAPDGSHDGGTFLEQAPYLEWRNSSYRDEGERPGSRATSCQGCHVPTRGEDGERLATRIAHNPMGRDFGGLKARQPFGRHTFVGGNALVPALLRDHADELSVEAPAAAFDGVIAAVRAQLGESTARVSIESPRQAGDRLRFDVHVQNLAGHKLPTAHPTRRAWLRVVVRDEAGAVLFASGVTDARGRIIDASGEPLPSEQRDGPIEPHRDVVRAAHEVAIYEAVMADAQGQPTFTLMRGASWYVDSRLLPHGWDSQHPDASRTAPVGVDGDDDFTAGGDRVHYELEIAATSGCSVEVSLVYQPLGARWLDELGRWGTPEIEALQRMLDTADLGPEVLGTDRVTL